jgi:hypothetical protein
MGETHRFRVTVAKRVQWGEMQSETVDQMESKK